LSEVSLKSETIFVLPQQPYLCLISKILEGGCIQVVDDVTVTINANPSHVRTITVAQAFPVSKDMNKYFIIVRVQDGENKH
jgi:hypothetical protein